jgi:hypothetical protein
MTWFFQELIQYSASMRTIVILLIPAGYLFWKYQKRREKRLYEALYRRERITRRILES